MHAVGGRNLKGTSVEAALAFAARRTHELACTIMDKTVQAAHLAMDCAEHGLLRRCNANSCALAFETRLADHAPVLIKPEVLGIPLLAMKCAHTVAAKTPSTARHTKGTAHLALIPWRAHEAT